MGWFSRFRKKEKVIEEKVKEIKENMELQAVEHVWELQEVKEYENGSKLHIFHGVVK